MARVVALDYDKARIGVALSDESCKIALPRGAILAQKSLEATAQQVWKELQTLGPLKIIVIGLPLHMSGKESPMSEEVRKFAALLEQRSGLPIHLLDERLTSKQGERLLQEADLKRSRRQEVIDSLSATLLLQSYLG